MSQVVLLRKAPIALRAQVRLLATVHSGDVPRQVAPVGQHFTALRALRSTLVGVQCFDVLG